jgi:hypothetical protein
LTQEYSKDSDPRTPENVFLSIPFGFSFFTAAAEEIDIHIYVLKIVLQEYILFHLELSKYQKAA